MKDEYLFQRFDTVMLKPPCHKDVPLSIRGFYLPQDYRNFISAHDGANLVFDLSLPDLDDVYHVELFSLEDILEGTCYRDSYGRFLGSEKSMREDFQSTWLGTRATENDIPYYDAPKLYEKFYTDNLVIGYEWSYWDEPIRWISLLAIDKNGQFVISDDQRIEHGLPAEWKGLSLQDLLERVRNS